ncbi:hypothetical protein [Sulfitobacter sp. CS16]|uniref:hypothetical protein n=1 Tax=Sulfitobacter sp. CS16 TaxID=3368573 RepID=UPI003746C9CE
MNDLPANQNAAWTPSSPERAARADHREWIGGRVVTLLSHYWRDDDDDALTAAIAADWADVLEGLPQEAIRKACIQYQREEPRRKPTPGAIYALAREAMPRPSLVRQPEPEQERREPTDEERARVAEYVRQAGYATRRANPEGDIA